MLTVIQFIEPWQEVMESHQKLAFEAELRKETAGHSATFYSRAKLIARRLDQDDFLFTTEDAQWPFAVVHLTFSGKAERKPWPITELHKNAASVLAKIEEDAELNKP